MKLNKLKEIIKVVEESDIEELEIKGLFRSVRVAKRRAQQISTSPASTTSVEEKAKEKAIYIKAPMVGTFYRSPSPGTPSYVEMGDRVIPGKIVCVIEAMKVMNEIEADVAGTIREILVKSEEPVEYGQPLFRVEPE